MIFLSIESKMIKQTSITKKYVAGQTSIAEKYLAKRVKLLYNNLTEFVTAGDVITSEDPDDVSNPEFLIDILLDLSMPAKYRFRISVLILLYLLANIILFLPDWIFCSMIKFTNIIYVPARQIAIIIGLLVYFIAFYVYNIIYLIYLIIFQFVIMIIYLVDGPMNRQTNSSVSPANPSAENQV